MKLAQLSGVIPPRYKKTTLQVDGIETIAVNSHITQNLLSLTDDKIIINSIEPSLDGIIVSMPYYNGTNWCVNLYNLGSSSASNLTLSVDFLEIEANI